MIAGLIKEYVSNAIAIASIDYADKKSVRRCNALADRMRTIVDQVVSLGQDAVLEFAALIDDKRAGSRVAHHLVEKAALDRETLLKCFARVEQARVDAEARGDPATARGEAMWLDEWRAKKNV